MVKTVGAVLDCFDDRPDEDREMLFEKFRVWQDNDASVRGAAGGLSVTRTRSATGCVGSRSVPADPYRGQGTSPNYVWFEVHGLLR
jgi:hypothetical protein